MTRINLYGDGLVRLSRNLGLVVGMLICSVLGTSISYGASITYEFKGVVDIFSPPELRPQFPNGLTMSGSMTVNTSDRNPNDTRGEYLVENFNVKFGNGYTATLEPSSVGNVLIGNAAIADDFRLIVPRLSGATLNPGGVPLTFNFALTGPSSLWGSDVLPNPVPSISSFTNLLPPQFKNRFQLLFRSGEVSGQMTSLVSLTAVPLPASVVLFFVGLVALAGLGTGTLRNYLRSPV